MDVTVIFLLLILLVSLVVVFRFGRAMGVRERDQAWQIELPHHRRDAVVRSRAVLGGQFSEQLAPYLPGFRYSPTECKFLGKPIDLIVFKGADEQNIEEVVFLEVKSGKSKLNTQEKSLKHAIDEGRVRFEEYRVDEGVTKRSD